MENVAALLKGLMTAYVVLGGDWWSVNFALGKTEIVALTHVRYISKGKDVYRSATLALSYLRTGRLNRTTQIAGLSRSDPKGFFSQR